MEIEEIRNNIDAIDDNMRSLFLNRMKLSDSIAEYKNKNSMPILDKNRERAILAHGELDIRSVF